MNPALVSALTLVAVMGLTHGLLSPAMTRWYHRLRLHTGPIRSAGTTGGWRLQVASVVRALSSLRERRAREAQLEEAVAALAAGLRAGMSMPVAIEQACRQVTGPLHNDLRKVMEQYQMGISLSSALGEWRKRARSREVDFLVEALGVLRQVGENMGEPLAQLVATLRQRRQARQEAWSLTAEARLSALVVGATPLVMVVFLAEGRSEAWSLLVSTSSGHLVLAGAGFLWCMGVAATVFLLRMPR